MVLLPKIPATSWSAAGTCTLWLVMAHVTPCPAQDTDWAAYVEKAHNHRRIMLRRAAARKVADAGAAAVPAVRAFQKKHGRDAIRMVLVSSYAVSKTADAATLGLLLEWAGDRDFYWRSQALKGLANRRRERPGIKLRGNPILPYGCSLPEC